MIDDDEARDYFCGAGGVSVGLHAAGFRVVGFDAWPLAIRTHVDNGLPAHVMDLSDPNDSADSRLFPMPDCLDLLAAFPAARIGWFSNPCQPFSSAGLGAGEFDERDGFPWALRIIAATLPPIVIFENVKGLTQSKHRPYLERNITALGALGYEVEQRVLNCADYGVPQTRERCIIIGRRDGRPIVWPSPSHAKGGADGLLPWISAGTACGWDAEDVFGFPRRADDEESIDLGDGIEYRARDLFGAAEPAQTVTEKGRSWTRWQLNTGINWIEGGSRDDCQTRSIDEPAPSVTAKTGTGQWRREVIRTHQTTNGTGERYERSIDEPSPTVSTRGDLWEVRAGQDANATVRMSDEPAPTVLARKDPNGWWRERPATTVMGDSRIWPPGHNVNSDDLAAGRGGNDRGGSMAIRVTLDELATLQGFPKGYRFHGNRTEVARQIGNAAPPALAEALARANR